MAIGTAIALTGTTRNRRDFAVGVTAHPSDGLAISQVFNITMFTNNDMYCCDEFHRSKTRPAEINDTSKNHRYPANTMDITVIFEGPHDADAPINTPHVGEITLMGVWKEACRHIEIAESTRNITEQLANLLPIGQLLVRRLDRRRPCLETVSLGVEVPEYLRPEPRSELSAEDVRRLDQWYSRLKPGRLQLGDPPQDLQVLVSPGTRKDATFVAALHGASRLAGALIVHPEPGQAFQPQHRALLSALVEPFSAALENDARLDEGPKGAFRRWRGVRSGL